MTKLEKEMCTALDRADNDPAMENVILGESDRFGKAAAEVAKQYIRNAYIEGYYYLADPEHAGIDGVNKSCDKWLKENGIIE